MHNEKTGGWYIWPRIVMVTKRTRARRLLHVQHMEETRYECEILANTHVKR
jgi:hypothetical protein